MCLAMLEITQYITYEVTPTGEDSDDDKKKGIPSDDDMNNETPVKPLKKKKKIQRIHVKIGIHSGRVISGVVGAKKPQYALFGDTVNTASRMKSTGEPGRIHASAATHEFLKEDLSLVWDPRHIEVKGKGLMDTYLLIDVQGTTPIIPDPPQTVGLGFRV